MENSDKIKRLSDVPLQGIDRMLSTHKTLIKNSRLETSTQ